MNIKTKQKTMIDADGKILTLYWLKSIIRSFDCNKRSQLVSKTMIISFQLALVITLVGSNKILILAQSIRTSAMKSKKEN